MRRLHGAVAWSQCVFNGVVAASVSTTSCAPSSPRDCFFLVRHLFLNNSFLFLSSFFDACLNDEHCSERQLEEESIQFAMT